MHRAGLADVAGRALSVCLFHLKFKTTCLANEFLDTRPTNYSASSQARPDSKPLFHDSADLRVYAAVQLRFWREVAQYGATPDRCKRCCATSAGFRTK